jgi:hypothetical protein
MVVVFMVHGEHGDVFPGKLATAPSTHPRVDLQGSLPVTSLPFILSRTAPRDDPVQFLFARFYSPSFVAI